MTEQEYLDKRVNDQIDWYGKKSAWNKRWFLRLRIAETILALLIPFITAFINEDRLELKITVGMLGVIVAASASIVTLYKLNENWIQYRSVCESLVHEKFLYITQSGPYKDGNSFPVFVEVIESYISKENTQWASYTKGKPDDKPAA